MINKIRTVILGYKRIVLILFIVIVTFFCIASISIEFYGELNLIKILRSRFLKEVITPILVSLITFGGLYYSIKINTKLSHELKLKDLELQRQNNLALERIEILKYHNNLNETNIKYYIEQYSLWKKMHNNMLSMIHKIAFEHTENLAQYILDSYNYIDGIRTQCDVVKSAIFLITDDDETFLEFTSELFKITDLYLKYIQTVRKNKIGHENSVKIGSEIKKLAIDAELKSIAILKVFRDEQILKIE